MRIKWHGHACFRLESDDLAVVTDPFDPDYLGGDPVTDPADVVVVSSLEDRGHSFFQTVQGQPIVVNALDHVDEPTTLPNGSKLMAIHAWESRIRPPGDEAKPNAMYRFQIDGVRIGHMGDIGAALSDEQIDGLRGEVDVLFVPIGVKLSIPLDALDDAISEVEPAIVIPMHYRTPRITYPFATEEPFLARHADDPIVRVNGSTYEVTRETLPERRTIVVLQAANA